MPQVRYKPLRITKAIIAQREVYRKRFWAGGFYNNNVCTGERPLLNVTRIQQLYPKLYQEIPDENSPYTPPNGQKHRCYTNYESFKNAADKEAAILETNNRLPTKEMTLHLLKVYLPSAIRKFRTKIFRYLKEHGITAVANIELTRDANGEPNNTVHFHILTGDLRSKEELKELLETACERAGLLKDEDFVIRCRKLPNPETYFDYFTKRTRTGKEMGVKRVLLFEKGIGLRKFYQIGKWFRKSKPELWKEFIEKTYGKKPKQKRRKNGKPCLDNS